MEPTKMQAIVDRLFGELYGEPLGDWVAAHREAGTPWRRIEKELYAKTNGAVDVSHVTLIAWYGESNREPAA